MKPLSLALIRSRYALDGGAERFIERALAGFKSQNLNVTLITRTWSDSADQRLLTCRPFYIGRVWRDWAFRRCACRLLQEHAFDLVQAHERIACCDIYRAGDGVHREWLRQKARVSGVTARLGTALSPYHYYVKAAERRVFQSPRVRAVICNSRMVKEEIRQYFSVAEQKLHVIYNGVDGHSFHPNLKQHHTGVRARYGIPSHATLFLFVGSGFLRKGLTAVLQALAQLPQNCFLIVVGNDKQAANFIKLADRLQVGQQVSFAGIQADVKPFYGAADALVLPTLYDPFPNVVLEAMASGLPVITSTKCGAAELINNGINGFVCDALDTTTLAQCMRRLSSAETRAALASKAHETVAGMTWERVSMEFLALYRTLLTRQDDL